MRLWIFILLVTHARGAEIPSKYPRTVADVSSINNLAQKPSSLSLDPKIRKALLNVLNRLELQDHYRAEAELAAQKTTASPQTDAGKAPADDSNFVGWEYKSADANASVDNRPAKTDEPGALFFQVPASFVRQSAASDDDKRETLHPQETQNDALSNPTAADLVLSDFPADDDNASLVAPPSNATGDQSQLVRDKDVEVFQAPLLTAFTLEQDERGLPRRIIPLEPIATDLRPTNGDDKLVGRRANDAAPIPTFRFNSDPLFPPALAAQDEHKRIRLEIEAQYRELLERKREIEQEKRRIIAEQERARQLRFELEQRQRQQAIGQNEIVRSEIAFQKSVEPHFTFDSVPSPGSHVLKTPTGQFFPDVVDKQLQNLFHRSGLGRQEDLNIVTKILALNHEGDESKVQKNTPRVARDWGRDLKRLDAKRIVRRNVTRSDE